MKAASAFSEVRRSGSAARARFCCGVDEAGRGPLAGPVVAAAVIFGPVAIAGVRDSKTLSARRRSELSDLIRCDARAWAIGIASVEEIDRLNILQASLLAMRRAVLALVPQAHLALIDGNRVPELPLPARAIVGGDASHPEISAASILAKTHRDELMRALDSQFPGYGFASHMGYPTPRHLACLRDLGPCAAHRRSFAPVRELLDAPALF